jgi:2-amino-4-hydroxy-6-hydroxymethyldihydropteridine diphosphokinase
MIQTFLGLGSNQQDPVRQIYLAIDAIKQLPETYFITMRPVIKTAAFGVIRQPLFYNTVVQIETALPPFRLLKHLQAIEITLGRRRYLPWGPRIIDIDILIYGNFFLRTPTLTLPHPQIWEREFVGMQLLELESPIIKKILQSPSNS